MSASRKVSVEALGGPLADLIGTIEAGGEVEITRGGVAVVRLVAAKRPPIRFGLLADRLDGQMPDLFEPMSEEDRRAWDGDR